MRAALHQAVLDFVRAPNPAAFDALAADVVRHQAETIDAYGRLVAARGGFGGDWRQAPLVPTDLFRELDLCAAAGDARRQ